MAKVLEEDSEELAMIQIGGNQLEMQTERPGCTPP